MDIAIIPFDDIPARFHRRTLYEEDFVVAMRARHPFGKAPTLDRYCEMQHLVVSHGGDAHGFVDRVLEKQGRSRRIALTVPNFMFALAVIAETDLVSALPRDSPPCTRRVSGSCRWKRLCRSDRFRLNGGRPEGGNDGPGLAWFFNVLAGAGTGQEQQALAFAKSALMALAPRGYHEQLSPRRLRALCPLRPCPWRFRKADFP